MVLIRLDEKLLVIKFFANFFLIGPELRLYIENAYLGRFLSSIFILVILYPRVRNFIIHLKIVYLFLTFIHCVVLQTKSQ